MCLLVLQAEKTKMKKSSFYNAHQSNKDGIWILIRKPNKEINVFKYQNVDLAWAKYESLKDEDYNLISIHFRLATSWWVNYEMMHPFPLGGKNWWWLLHNGSISNTVMPSIEWVSDTASLAEYIKDADLTERQLYSYPIRYFLSTICWTYNKFLVISPNKWILYNEKAWHWKDGLWYSNYTYASYNSSYKYVEEDEDFLYNWRNII